MKILRLALFLPLLLTACISPEAKNERLARKYCGSCHLFPAPHLLDKGTWDKRVLPEMAVRMGLDIARLPSSDTRELQTIMRSLPSAPLLTQQEWRAIQSYYRKTAPQTLAPGPHAEASPLVQLKAEAVRLPIPAETSLTLIQNDERTSALLIGTRNGNLYRLNGDFRVQDSLFLNSAPSDVHADGPGDLIVACMGIMDPNDLPAGRVIRLGTDGQQFLLIDSLRRPVSVNSADFNMDGEADLLVASFGNYTGDLSLYQKSNANYTRHPLHHFPGTRRVAITDVNDDGLPDFYALITQGDEHIALFTNRGNFRFSYRVVMKFPPVYGSSYFDLADMNGDGAEDILYTNGDNADYSPVLKPYHGVRIFLNDGKHHFHESWFYPMHGASMARAVDFDEDGDLDIAAISFFPDFARNPQRGFLYFENHGGSFTAFETPLAASSRWITMEVADIDDDRDADIILGALNFPTGVPDSLVRQWKEKPTSLLVLRNVLR